MLVIPQSLIDVLKANPMPEMDPELPPIWLAEPHVLDKMQLGYRIHGISGEDLTGTAEGDWQPDWVVIGEGLCSDPLFVNINEFDQGFPVYTAEHGAGSWEALKVADSVAAFVKILNVLNDRIQDTAFDADGFIRDIEYFTDETAMWEECAEGIIESREDELNGDY